MLDIRVKGRVGEKEVFRPGCLQLQGGLCHLLRINQAMFPALNMRIGAVDTTEGAAPFALEIEHTAMLKIKTIMPGLLREGTIALPLPGWGLLDRDVR